MRKITEESINAFYNNTPFKKGNTEIEVLSEYTVMKLHGNSIAFKYNDNKGTIKITTTGWQTNTTKERLNGIDGVSLVQRKGEFYLNNQKWDGSLITI